MVHAEITTFSGHRKENWGEPGLCREILSEKKEKEREKEREKKGKKKGGEGGKKARLPCKLLSSCKILPT